MHHADGNVKAFARELGREGLTVTGFRRKSYRDIEGDCRGYALTFEDGRITEILMPDQPVDMVRTPESRHKEGDLLGYRQINVDGSWLRWPYAISTALQGPDPDYEPCVQAFPETNESRTWHSLWKSDHWVDVTTTLPVFDREYAADQVVAHLRHLAARDGMHLHREPLGLRWWEPETA